MRRGRTETGPETAPVCGRATRVPHCELSVSRKGRRIADNRRGGGRGMGSRRMVSRRRGRGWRMEGGGRRGRRGREGKMI